MLINQVYTQEALQKVVKKLLTNGADFAEAYMEKSSLQSISCEENKIESIASGIDVGLGLRIVQGEETYYASTNNQDLEEILALAGSLSQAAGKRQIADDRWQLTDKRISSVHNILREPHSIEITEKIALVSEVVRLLCTARSTMPVLKFSEKTEQAEAVEQVRILGRGALGGVQDEAEDVGSSHGRFGGVVGGGSECVVVRGRGVRAGQVGGGGS